MGRSGCLGVVLFLICITLKGGFLAAQTSTSPWLGNQLPKLQKQIDDVSPTLIPPYSNKDCQPDITFVTQPLNMAAGQLEQSAKRCAVPTAVGMQSATDAHIRPTGSRLAGPVYSLSGSRLIGNAIPMSKHFLFQSGGLYGSKQYIVKNFSENSQSSFGANGAIRYQLTSTATITPVTDREKNPLEFADIRFSSNGAWGVGDVPLQGLTRFNTETGESLTFGDPYNYSIGLRPTYVLAISSDGRYVFATAVGYEILKVFDLSTCQPIPNSLRAQCSSKDLLPLFRSEVAGFQNIHHAQFSTNDSIRLYTNSTANNKIKTDYFLLQAAGTSESRLDYLALGDSFASGEGLFDYRTYTDVEQPFNKCHLSDFSYPFLLKVAQNFNQVESVACSGAKAKDIVFHDPTKNYRSDGRQSHGKENHLQDSEVYENFLVGYRTQIDFVSRYKPKTVTVSIGGNDIGFGHIIASCVAPKTCYRDPEQRSNLAYTISAQLDPLTLLFGQIKDAAASNASIHVHGYPSLANENGSCGVNVRLDKEEIIFGNNLVNQLNDVISKAARAAHVTYVDITHIFDGYRLCENKGDQLAVNGLTAGNDRTFSLAIDDLAWTFDFYLTGRESYHPTKLGHQLYARALSQPAQENLPTSAPQSSQSTSSSPRLINQTPGLVPSMLLRNQVVSLRVQNISPSTVPQLFLDNQIVQSDGALFTGNAYTTKFLVSSVPGSYTVRLQAKSSSGELVEFQKAVYVADRLDDIDGDTIPNFLEKCLLVEPANVDEDRDGQDDGCDSLIGPSPLPLTILTMLSHRQPLQPLSLLDILHYSENLNTGLPPPLSSVKTVLRSAYKVSDTLHRDPKSKTISWPPWLLPALLITVVCGVMAMKHLQ